MYRLCSLIVHHGSANGGHYTTYRRLSLPSSASDGSVRDRRTPSVKWGSNGSNGHVAESKWVHVSDEHVRDVSVEEVLMANAYMLFYSAW
jgi:ubiquitin C-terminal hydrolase